MRKFFIFCHTIREKIREIREIIFKFVSKVCLSIRYPSHFPFHISVRTMPTAGLAAIAALLVLDARKNDIASGGVAVKKIASCAGFSVEAVAEGFIVGLSVILGGGHAIKNGGRITTKVQRKKVLNKFPDYPTSNPNFSKRL